MILNIQYNLTLNKFIFLNFSYNIKKSGTAF